MTNHDDQDKKPKNFKPFKYIGMMGLCCLLPIIIVAVLPLLQIKSLGANTLIASIAPLICPIMMGLMMIGLFKDSKGHSCCGHKDKDEKVSEKSE